MASQKKKSVPPKPGNVFGGVNGPWSAAVLIPVYFLILCLSSASTSKGVAAAAALCAAAALAFGRKRVAGRLSAPFLAMALWVAMNGISTLYAISGKFALQAFVAVLTSFSCVIVLLALANGRWDRLGRGFATVLEGTAALAGLVSIDLFSTRLLSTPVLSLLGLFTQDYAVLNPVEAGVRMNSLFTNPNVFSGCMGIGVFLSLGLALTSRRKGGRRFHLACLYLNALSFFLAFSMGASAAIAAGFLAYLLLERRRSRGAVLVLMSETLVLVAAAGFLVSATSLTEWSGFQPIPLACAAIGAALLCAADQHLGQRLGRALEAHDRVVPVLMAAALLSLTALGAAAMTLTGPAALEGGETLRRAARPQPGTYVLSVAADGAVNVTLESQNMEDAMMHTGAIIYSGPADGAVVEVPEDSVAVYASISSDAPVTLESMALEGEGGATAFPLGYILLPEFMANRLQGLWANENAIQRLVFFQDGLKLFRRSPVFGLGMGAFENGVCSVQSFYYETKYAHNHYIESLVETGVVGLLLFVGMLAAALAAVVRTRRGPEEEAAPLTAALGGALIFMAGHGAVEVVFSSHVYLPMALGVLGLTALCCGRTMPLPAAKEGVRKGIVWSMAALLLGYTVLLGGNMVAGSMARRERTFPSMERAIALDRFEWADYALSYVIGSMQMDPATEEISSKAAAYAERLQEVDSNTIPLYLAQYYFETGDPGRAFEMLDKYTDYVASDPEAWRQSFQLVMQYGQYDPACREPAAALYQKMLAWNESHMGALTLPESTMSWLARLGAL